eukprot:jgi/Ulvmu1/3621/UM017_0033.1
MSDDDDLSFGSTDSSESSERVRQELKSPRGASPQSRRSPSRSLPTSHEQNRSPPRRSLGKSKSPSPGAKPEKHAPSIPEVKDSRGNRSPGKPPRAVRDNTVSDRSRNRGGRSGNSPPNSRAHHSSPSYTDRHRDDRHSDRRNISPTPADKSIERQHSRSHNVYRGGDSQQRPGPPQPDERHRSPPHGRRPHDDGRNGHSARRPRSLSPGLPPIETVQGNGRSREFRRDVPPRDGRQASHSGMRLGDRRSSHRDHRPAHTSDARPGPWSAQHSRPHSGQHGRPPRGPGPRGDGPPRYEPAPKRTRESEAEVVNRIETYEGAASPAKRRRNGDGRHEAGDAPRHARVHSGVSARGGGRGGGYDEAARDAGTGALLRPPRQESGPRGEHPAEALRGARREPRPPDGRPGAPQLPGPPPRPPAGCAAPAEGGPNFMLSGVLAADSKRDQRGVVQKYAPPDDACMPTTRWRIYIYKGDPGTGDAAQQGKPITLIQGKKTHWVLGKDRQVCDIFAQHGSISREHAVVQFKRGRDGLPTPYIMDLESVNGTHIVTAEANEKLEPLRYYRLISQDTVRLGGSSRDYVFIDESELDPK